MKFGCLLLLITLGGVFAGYSKLLQESEFKDQWWIPGLLAFFAAMIVGSAHGLVIALKQKRASTKQRSEWNDGDLVVVSGNIQSLRSPIVAPFSGRACCILEYEIKLADTESAVVPEYHGFMMSPCTIVTTQGGINLVGFPLLTKIASEDCIEDSCFSRAGEFIKNTKFQERESNPIALIKQLNEVITRLEGDIQAHFRVKSPSIEVEEISATDITNELREIGLRIQETLIPPGAEVTVFGTYLANKQAIDIGGGLSNLNHKLELGKVGTVTGADIRKSLIGVLIAGAIFCAGNYFLLERLGLRERFGL